MSEITVLDTAHQASANAPDDAALRMRFYERLADSELFLLLERESDGTNLEPQVFPAGDSSIILVFDRERRLADFVGKPAPYAVLSGRQIIRLLADQQIGLGVNLGIPTSETILPPDTLVWIGQMLDHAPTATEARPNEVTPPGNVPAELVSGLEAKLASAAGLARRACFSGVTYDDGRTGHLLAFVETRSGAEDALAAAAGEALTFSGIDAGEMDVVFLRPEDPLTAAMERVGLIFDIPKPEAPQVKEIRAPGMNPDEPPILT